MQINQYPEKLIVDNTDNLMIQDTANITKRIKRENFIAGLLSSGAGVKPWNLINTAYTALPGDRLIVDNTQNFTLTLPSSPTAFTEIELIGYKLPFDLKFASVKKISSTLATSVSLATTFKRCHLIFLDDTVGWLDVNSVIKLTPPATQLNYASNGDTNGVIYYLGTEKLTHAFFNPSTNGIATLTATPAFNASFGSENATNRVSGSSYLSDGTNNSFWKIDLLANKSLTLKGYTIKKRGGHDPKSWDLEGSTDNVTWSLIDRQVNNLVFNSSDYFYQAITNQTTSYRYLRFTQTGQSLTGTTYLAFDDIELYGGLSWS